MNHFSSQSYMVLQKERKHQSRETNNEITKQDENVNVTSIEENTQWENMKVKYFVNLFFTLFLSILELIVFVTWRQNNKWKHKLIKLFWKVSTNNFFTQQRFVLST